MILRRPQNWGSVSRSWFMNRSSLQIDRSTHASVRDLLRHGLNRIRQASESKLLHKVAETYITQILRVGLGFMMTILVARILDPQERGLYAIALAVGALGVQFGNFGLTSSNIYYVAKNRDLIGVLAGNGMLVSLFVGGLGALLIGGIFHAWPRLAPVHGTILNLALLTIPFSLAYLLLQSLLLGVLDVRAYNTIELASKALGVVLVLLFWMLRYTSIEAMLLSFDLVQITTFVWALRRIKTLAAPAGPQISLKLLLDQISLAFRAYLVLLSSFLVLRFDLFMVKYMLGAERAGQYSVAASMADYVVMLPVVAGTVLFPKLSAMQEMREKLRLAKKAALLVLLLMLPVVVLAALLAKTLVVSVFGRAYLPAAQAFVWLLPGIFFLGVESVAVQFLNSLGYPRSVVITWLVCMVVNVCLNFWGIPLYGIVGASFNSSITYILASVLIIGIVAKTQLAAAPIGKLGLEVSP